MKIKFTREVDTEEMYENMMREIFKHPYCLISDEAILNEFKNEWRNETNTEACNTVSLEEIIIILYEFKGYVKNHLFENNC